MYRFVHVWIVCARDDELLYFGCFYPFLFMFGEKTERVKLDDGNYDAHIWQQNGGRNFGMEILGDLESFCEIAEVLRVEI